MSFSSYRSTIVWEQISSVIDGIISETGIDLDARGDISVQMREDTPNAKIKTVITTESQIKVAENPNEQLYELLFPLIKNALKDFHPKHESVTLIELVKSCKKDELNLTTTRTKFWFVSLKTGLLLTPKIAKRNPESQEIASTQLKQQIPKFLAREQSLNIFVKNGNFSGIKHTKKVKISEMEAKDAFYQTLMDVLFSGKTRNQHEFVGSFADGRLFMAQEIKHEDFHQKSLTDTN